MKSCLMRKKEKNTQNNKIEVVIRMAVLFHAKFFNIFFRKQAEQQN